ncbi:hypothetical protein [Streptomyces rhizosphaerihabitans]|uniref:hypothetical protein n=1 Tax=Streptomyces rhizosphaerihabitans TaxID=1266770 RepID=UPI0021C0ABC3|nr:hypothetical protein [Streptomyces rhizosphaerihabitans]MCT9008329.1 hypothetical protein [Streptomyces rhizosphaerihabitans]
MNDQPTPGAEDDGTAVLAPDDSAQDDPASDDPAQDGNTATPVPVDSATARSGDGGSPSDTLPPPFGT